MIRIYLESNKERFWQTEKCPRFWTTTISGNEGLIGVSYFHLVGAYSRHFCGLRAYMNPLIAGSGSITLIAKREKNPSQHLNHCLVVWFDVEHVICPKICACIINYLSTWWFRGDIIRSVVSHPHLIETRRVVMKQCPVATVTLNNVRATNQLIYPFGSWFNIGTSHGTSCGALGNVSQCNRAMYGARDVK